MNSSSICGDPNCGTSFICSVDYNRLNQPYGYPGVPKPEHENFQSKIPAKALCQTCKRLDLSSDASDPNLSQLTDKGRKLIGNSPSCPFCRLVKSCTFLESGPVKWNAERGFYRHMDSPRIVFLDNPSGLPPHKFGRVVKPQVDFQLLKRWLRLCEDNHKLECAQVSEVICTANTKLGLKTLRVIDVEKMCIVEAKVGCRYLTLSYSWGQIPSPCLNQGNKAQLMKERGLKSLSKAFPRTISDAIHLVKLLGERYIWIDRLCLVQDDGEDMRDGMQKMDLVYEGAVLCIVAAAGHDAGAGLPGVQANSRNVEQHIEKVTPEVKMTVVDLLFEVLSQAQYMTRGWTYQELMLAPRCLIFLGSRIYFRCCRVVWSEDTIYDEFPFERHGNTGMSQNLPVLRNTTAHGISTYQQSVVRYSSRKLTDEGDAINAMAGILQRIARDISSSVFEGMLTSHFDLCLLFWHLAVPAPQRRRGFPSWSWAGWKNNAPQWPPELDGQEADKWMATKTHIVWYQKCLQTGEMKLICGRREHRERYNQRYGAAEEHQNATQLQNLQTKPTFNILLGDISRTYPPLQFWTWSVLIPRLEKLHEGFAAVIDAENEKCGAVHFDGQGYSLEAVRPHEALLLSKADSCATIASPFNAADKADQPFYWIILVEWEGMQAERKALGYIYQSRINHLLPPGRIWKEIVLV